MSGSKGRTSAAHRGLARCSLPAAQQVDEKVYRPKIAVSEAGAVS
jgi:hypothetical protein